MKKCTGLAGAGGKATGKIILISSAEAKAVKREIADPEGQISLFHDVQEKYAVELNGLYEKTKASLGEESAGIFSAYLAMRNPFF